MMQEKIPYFLVADDDPVTRLMLCRFLEKIGYEALGVKNGAEAVRCFEERVPDVVLMDAKMPVMDGFQACLEIKRQPDSAHVPVIMITGLHDDESVDRAFAVGATDFVPKPIHWAILRNRVRYLIQILHTEKQLYLAASVLENTAEGVVVTGPDATILSVNPAFERITGYAPEEVVGQRTSLLRSGRHEASFYQNLWASLTSGNSWQGEIWNRKKSGEIYPQWSHINAIRTPNGSTINYVMVFSDLTAAKESEESLLYLTGHDLLTGLPNRLMFHERLGHLLADARREDGALVAVFLLDLDRFKVVNDTMGHDMGDRLLVEVAQRLSGSIPPQAVLARMGGDEFGIVLPRLESADDAATLARHILACLSELHKIDDMEFYLGCSIGIGIYPLDGQDVKTLTKNTDAAMSHAKEQGRNNWQFYRQAFNTASLARMLLENSLRSALERQEFLLYYQPQIDLRNMELAGVEALIRWNHPEKGMVSPGDFIPLAEATGLIIPIGRWVLLSACHQAKSWLDAGYPPVRMGINLSGIQFKLPDFPEQVLATINDVGLDPRCVELELTESIAMGDVAESLTKLLTLSRSHIRLAIDDFGTGFSSFGYLKKFPVNTLKIDQSFVRTCTSIPEDAAIVRAFIGIAHSLGLKVIAEGVETEEQLDFLRQEQCDEIQGYFFSRPLSASAFQSFMDSWLTNKR
ncbi:MAG: EAL domain-containing protein [Magnetococcales bacterium]|nr:EAL domain-containing protein [Magnetococcales bacterium]MBF0321768.1 EAL domain-containing protein [Magnetococcales bacterium]